MSTRPAFSRNLSRRLIDSLSTAGINRGMGPAQRYLLTVDGRKSHSPRTTPVSLVADGVNRYLVGPYGEVGWVRNARVSGEVTLSRAGHSEKFEVTAVDGTGAGSILKLYLKLEPMMRPYFGVRSDAPDEEFAAEVATHPVFRLTPKPS